MGRRSRVLAGVLVAVTALGIVVAGSARADTATIGSSLTGTFTENPTFTLSTRANLALPPPATAASPVDGTVVSWSFIGSSLVPRVIRPTGGGLYTGAGTGPVQAGSGPGAISGPFPLSLPIQQGDLFGVNTTGTSAWSGRDTAGAARGTWPPLLDGGAPDAPTIAPREEMAIQATVRYCKVPKLKGKSPKRARKALRKADCAVGDVERGKAGKRKRVIRQSVKAGRSISDTEPVDLKVSRKRAR